MLTNQCILFSCVHIYREANITTNILSKDSHKQYIIQYYYTYNKLPQAQKGSYILKKMGVQNLKRKKMRKIKQPP